MYYSNIIFIGELKCKLSHLRVVHISASASASALVPDLLKALLESPPGKRLSGSSDSKLSIPSI